MIADAEQQVRRYIVDSFLFGEGGDDLTSDQSLLDAGIIDSSGILELVSFLEDTFQLKVTDEELVPANFDSIARIVAFVNRRTEARS